MMSEFFGLFRGDWADKFFATLLVIITTVVVFVAGYGLFWVADFSFREDRVGTGEVRERSHSEESIQTTFMMVGKILVPRTIHRPERWGLDVKFGDAIFPVNVTQETYNSSEVGQTVTVKYRTGRLTGSTSLSGVAVD